MREVKFRAWNKTKKVMVCNSPFISWCVGDGTATISEYVPHNGGYALNSVRQLSHYEFDNFIFMQFTGLKDENGKEIYEGDILGYCDNYPGLVFWDSTCHRWSLLERYPKGEYNREHELDYLTEPMKILGNIHENPDLLEGE